MVFCSLHLIAAVDLSAFASSHHAMNFEVPSHQITLAND